MQPILAEPAPVRGRALVLAVALTVAASIASIASAAAVTSRHHGRWHHHRHVLPYNGQCPYGYVYVSR